MNSLVLGMMSRLRARITWKALCPQKPRCRRSFSNPGHHGTAVRCDEMIDTTVVQAGNYGLRHHSPSSCKEYQLTVSRANGSNWHQPDMPGRSDDVRS